MTGKLSGLFEGKTKTKTKKEREKSCRIFELFQVDACVCVASLSKAVWAGTPSISHQALSDIMSSLLGQGAISDYHIQKQCPRYNPSQGKDCSKLAAKSMVMIRIQCMPR